MCVRQLSSQNVTVVAYKSGLCAIALNVVVVVGKRKVRVEPSTFNLVSPCWLHSILYFNPILLPGMTKILPSYILRMANASNVSRISKIVNRSV